MKKLRENLTDFYFQLLFYVPLYYYLICDNGEGEKNTKNKCCYQLKNSISERATNYLDFYYYLGKSVGFVITSNFFIIIFTFFSVISLFLGIYFWGTWETCWILRVFNFGENLNFDLLNKPRGVSNNS